MDVQIDMNALIEQVKNDAAISLVRQLCPDDDSKQKMEKILRVFTARGVNVETAFCILTEIVNVIKGDSK